MAQASKKDQIAAAALPLFLQNGFKGTSIDQVVKTSRVSKPTVYNHFPDKTALMDYVIDRWLTAVSAPAIVATTEAEFVTMLGHDYFDDDALKMFALVIGEGRRFVLSRKKFLETFTLIWRGEVDRWSDKYQFDTDRMQVLFSHHLLLQLTKIDAV